MAKNVRVQAKKSAKSIRAKQRDDAYQDYSYEQKQFDNHSKRRNEERMSNSEWEGHWSRVA